jgi:hypothetical protein
LTGNKVAYTSILVIYLIFVSLSLIYFFSGVFILVDHLYSIGVFSIYSIIYLLIFIIQRNKYNLIIFCISIFNLIILIILNNCIYLEYVYHEEEYYSVKDDVLFGLFGKYPVLFDISLISVLFSYILIIIISVVLMIKNIVNIYRLGAGHV